MRKPPLQDVIVMKPTQHRARAPEDEREGYRAAQSAHQPVDSIRPQRPAPTQRRYEQEEYGAPNHESRGGGRDTQYDIEEDVRPGRVDKRWTLLAAAIGAVVVGTAFALSMLFAGAHVTVYPKQDTVVANATFTAREDGAENALPFKRMVIERTAVQDVVALDEQEVEERAQGVITIFNEYSDTPQRLIKNTRFEAPDGKIYRIRESVEVPGKKSSGVPGTVDVTVYAEEPGESYNRGPESFTIPGFADMPQDGKVYAKSTGEITGGFVGVRRTVEEADRLAAIESLESKLRDELLAEIANTTDKPANYRSFSDAVFFEFSTLPDDISQADTVRVSLSGKLHAVLFEESTLASRLARVTIGSYEGSPIRIENMGDLAVRVAPALAETDDGEPVAPWNAPTYTVSVSGKAVFIWEYDEEAFAQDLTGKDKAILEAPATQGILSAYPGIDRAYATVRPFWKSTFPEEAADITITTKLDE